jgi:1-acyl-sn-glycerol-3-phosphate acyltransferase
LELRQETITKGAWQASVQCLIQHGDFLCIFPEGTRTRTGKLQEFKLGYLRLAAHSGAPVIPVRLDQNFEVWPPQRPFPRLRKVSIVFHEPVRVARGLSLSALRQLNADIRARYYHAS